MPLGPGHGDDMLVMIVRPEDVAFVVDVVSPDRLPYQDMAGVDRMRAIARQAEAERERRARVINAEGEQQAAAKLLEAAEILSARPEAMQLRYLGALGVIANERTSTIVFPFPTDLTDFLSPGGGRGRK